MEMNLELEVMGREVIKPATPSPHNHIQLSLLDVFVPGTYVSTIFLYKSEDLVTSSPETISKKLKSSLSETLSRFYPLAGEIEGVSVNCNDRGAVFTEARANLLLPEFLKTLNVDYSLAELRPKIEAGDSPTGWPLLSVGVTFFRSGSGVAVSVNVSHRICDAASLLTLVTDWSATMANKKSTVGPHQFAEATVYPPAPPHMALQFPTTDSKKCVMNRFVFESSKISELKRKAASESVETPTRVEAITSFIWKCATNASRSSNLMAPRSTLMFESVDLRLKVPSSVLPQDAIGNLQTAFFLKRDVESEIVLHETVAAFMKAKEEVYKMLKDNVQSNTLGYGLLNTMGNLGSELKPDVDIYTMSSWLGKPLYGVDFGWGSPVWVGSASHTSYDKLVYVLLMDSKDGEGVEAWISSPAEDMSVFVHDQEMLAYVCIVRRKRVKNIQFLI